MIDNYESSFHPHTHHQPIQETLSRIISEISHLLHYALKLLLKQDPLPYLECLSSFEAMLSRSLLHTSNYEQKQASEISTIPLKYFLKDCSVIRRFSCRLIENLLPFKQRTENSKFLKPLQSLIQKIENCLMTLQTSSNLEKFIECVGGIFLTFLAFSKKRTKFEETNEDNKKKAVTREVESINIRDNRSKSFHNETDQEKKLRKIVMGINTRFKTLQSMDIDYQHFRSSFFETKNNSEFLNQYLERNLTISNQIKNYDKGYQQYIKRKDKRRTQRAFQQNSPKKLLLNKTDRRGTNQYGQSWDQQTSIKINNWASDREKLGKLANKKYSLNQVMSPLRDCEANKIKFEVRSIKIPITTFKLEMSLDTKFTIKNNGQQLEGTRKKWLKVDQKLFFKNLIQLGQKPASTGN